MQTLDSTITNVALPKIQGNLGASSTRARGSSRPTRSRRSSSFRSRRGCRTASAASTTSSRRSSASRSPRSRAARRSRSTRSSSARVVQGTFGGGLLATAQAILRDTFPPEQLGVSQGIFALGAIMGPALGPPLGGFSSTTPRGIGASTSTSCPGIVLDDSAAHALARSRRSRKAGPVDVVGLLLSRGPRLAAIRADRGRAELLVRRYDQPR